MKKTSPALIRNSSRRVRVALASGLLVNTLFATGVFAMTDEVYGMCQQAEQLINSGKFKDALNLLENAQQKDPSCGEVHGYMGMAFQNGGNTQKALAEYTTAYQLNPQMSFMLVNIGNCYLNLNHPDQAAGYFQKYLQENPNAPDAAQARRSLQQCGARKGQTNLRSSIEQGQAFLSQRKFNEARQAFENATAADPNFAPGHFYLGYALASLGQHERAIAEFQTTLKLSPNTKEAMINIASNYQSLGDCNSAITWYQRYLKENPGSAKAADVRSRIEGLKRQASKQAQSPDSQSQPDYLADAAPNGQINRWPAQKIPLRVYIDPGKQEWSAVQQNPIQALREAFSNWSQATEGRVTFMPVTDANQADIICVWTDDPEKIVQAGRAVEGGLTKLSMQPHPNGSEIMIVRASVTLLTNRGGTPLGFDEMKKVCLHEVGHALGLNGHSNNNKDIMFYSESPSIWPALTKRDKATMLRLYSNYPPAPRQ